MTKPYCNDLRQCAVDAVISGQTTRVVAKHFGVAVSSVVKWHQRYPHPRWTLHFTPTSSSWLNAVEGFFAKLTRRRLKHGVFYTLVDLQAAINRFIKEYNVNEAKPFIWKADPNKIIAARNRGFQTLESFH